ncbi:DUF493 domain-containing protein [Nitrosomonas sp.]|uniref:HP0495 family protein n=1 Tax=Nitrosomonas sp. TaxID=42353 RepID=UPI0025DABD46|nr:DUF493 domain-containing protein [Nitrosomonas sp.]
MTEESLIKYPCDFPIKIMGKSQQGFTQSVLEIVKIHAPDFDDATLEVRTSRSGTYMSLTCTIRATSREQLDSIYQALHSHPMVTMLL